VLSNLSGIPLPQGESDRETEEFVDEVVDWLRNNPPTPTSITEADINALANTSGVQIPRCLPADDKRAVFLESIDWLRSNEPSPESFDEPMVQKLANLGGIPTNLEVAPEVQQSVAEHAIEWLRQNKPKATTISEPTVEVIANAAGVPISKPRLEEIKQTVVNQAVDWVRANKPDPEQVDEPTLDTLANLAGVPNPSRPLEPSEQQDVLDTAVEWLRNNQPGSADMNEPLLNTLANMANISIPRSRIDLPNDEYPVSTIDWLRSNGAKNPPLREPNKPGLRDASAAPLANLPQETKEKVLDLAIDWLRNNEPNPSELDESTINTLSNIAGVPLQSDIPSEEKQVLANDVVEWLRQKNPNPTSLDEPTIQALMDISGVPMPSGVPEPEKKKVLDQAIEWLRHNSPNPENVDLPTLEKVTALAGVPPPETELNRSDKKRGMEEAIDWLRSREPTHAFGNPPNFTPNEIDVVGLPNLNSIDDVPSDSDKVMEWLRKKGAPVAEVDTPRPLDYRVAHPEKITGNSSDDSVIDWNRDRDGPDVHNPFPIGFNGPTGFQGNNVNPTASPALDTGENTVDWNRNRLGPDIYEPYPAGFSGPEGPKGIQHRPGGTDSVVSTNDSPVMDWNRNRSIPPETEPTGVGYHDPHGPSSAPTRSFEEPADSKMHEQDYPPSDWVRNRPGPEEGVPLPLQGTERLVLDLEEQTSDFPLKPVKNPDVIDSSAPWASSPDEDSNDGRGPKPMALPEDVYSEPSSEEREEPKGTVIPIPMMLTVAVVASVMGASAMSGPSPAQSPVSPNVVPTNPTGKKTLPAVEPPKLPCIQDPACQKINFALNPVAPPSTMANINIPGTCQNWSREWLRTGSDIMSFQVERIRQRFAMALMYCEFNGDNWLEGDLWVSELHECDWYTMIGVDPCGRKEQYQIIRNHGQQMQGTIPPEISMISTLWEVTLADNLLSGSIPSNFDRLSELDTISLSFNMLTGDIPTFMWEFFDMTHMDLAYNFFKGTIPDNTVSKGEKNLEVLFLENNDLTGSIPQDFGSMNWRRLHLDGNQFTGTIPSNIHSTSMEELMLHNNQLSGTFPSSEFADDVQGGKSPLTHVTIHNNNLQGNVDEMCPLQQSGSLTTFEVDTSKVSCSCCSPGT